VEQISNATATGVAAVAPLLLTDTRIVATRKTNADWFAEQFAILEARQKARALAALFPRGFSRALPRGYTVLGTDLVMLKVETNGEERVALYGPHRNWQSTEATAFENDLRTGLATEFAASMRWYLRADPQANADFQAALTRLRESWDASAKPFS